MSTALPSVSERGRMPAELLTLPRGCVLGLKWENFLLKGFLKLELLVFIKHKNFGQVKEIR